MNEYTKNGILYTWELCSSEGASFILFPSPENTQEEINAAKLEIKSDHDCVWLRVANDDDRDYLYKTAIFREPDTKPLPWYQINQDETLIRKERIKGTAPADFVKRFILPFIKETEQLFLQKHGETIYNR